MSRPAPDRFKDGEDAPGAIPLIPGLNVMQEELADYSEELAAGKANTSHTHTIGNVTGLQSALDGKADDSEISALTSAVAAKADAAATTTALAAKQATSEKGQPDGYAPLDGSGKVPSANLPSAGSGSEPTASIVTFDQPGTIAVATGKGRVRMPTAATIISVAATVNTAPTGAAILVDVNKNGTTVFTTQANRPSIAASGFASADALPDVTSLAAGDYLTVDIDQVGSTIAGADLTVIVELVMAAPDGTAAPDGVSPHAASIVTFSPSGSLAATNVQTAITEASADLDAHLTDTVDAHDASAISYLGGPGTAATDVEGALDELSTEKLSNPMTTAGDVIVGGASGAPTRVAKGSNNTVFGVDGSGNLGYKADPAGGGGTTYDLPGETQWRASDIIAVNLPRRTNYSSTNGGIASGRLMYAGGFVIPAGQTVNKIRMWNTQTTSGLTHSWAALVTKAGVIVGKSADITTDWTGATNPPVAREFVLTAGAAAGGSDLPVAVVFCFVYSTTAPSLGACASNSVQTAISPVIAGSIVSGLTSGPSDIGAVGASISPTAPTAANALGQLYYAELI